MNQIRSTKCALVAATITTALSACGDHPTRGPAREVTVQTAETVYEIPPPATDLSIETVVTHTMDEPLLLDGLGRDFVRLDKFVGGSWRPAYLMVYDAPWVPDIELAPGESGKLTIRLYIWTEPNRAPRFEYDIPGRYRAVFSFRTPSAPSFEVRSNEFELRAAR